MAPHSGSSSSVTPLNIIDDVQLQQLYHITITELHHTSLTSTLDGYRIITYTVPEVQVKSDS